MNEYVYTTAQTCELLRLTPEAPRKLSRRGLLPSNGVHGPGSKYAKQWVEDLARLLALYPPMKHRDEALFELYALHREYYAIPADLTRGRRDVLRARLKPARDSLVASGRVWTLTRLADAVNLPLSKLNHWANTGKLSAILFGQSYFVTARYARYVVDVLTKWPTIAEAAAQADASESSIKVWVAKYDLGVARFADGLHRLDPVAFKEFLLSRRVESAVPLAEAARRMGCSFSALVGQVSLGNIVALGPRSDRRIPDEEVIKWTEWFRSLNAEFAWLQPVIALPDRKTPTLTARQVMRRLNVSSGSVSTWSQAGLLPFFPRSFSVVGRIERLFVRRYIDGLVRYAAGVQVKRWHLVTYKEICQQQGNIV